MAFLTDRTLVTGLTTTDLIHIVNPNDTSQNPAGSSYKATLGQFVSLLPPFTGGSGNCITDFYVTNIYGCSPITINSETNFFNTSATGILSFSQGLGSQSIGNYSHSEGTSTQSIGTSSHAEGNNTTSIGQYSHAEGFFTISSGSSSHSEGRETTSVGNNSHAEGFSTISMGMYSHAEGENSESIGTGSHAEGVRTQSIGFGSHSEGSGTTTYGNYSHSEGLGTITNGSYQHIQGQFNFTSSTQSAFIIGNGTSDLNRSNLVFAVGNQVDIYGDLLVTGTTSADTIVITSTPTTASTLNEVIIRDSSSGELKYYDFTHSNFGLFAQTGNSTTVSATTSELTLVDGGIGSLTIPANFFKPGDSFRVRMGGFVSAANGETLIIRVKSDLVTLGSDTISFPNTSNRNWMLDADFTIRTIGGIGVASIVSNGFFTFNTSSDVLGGGFATINNTTFDTTISNTLDITAQWGSNNASNSIYSVNFVLAKTF